VTDKTPDRAPRAGKGPGQGAHGPATQPKGGLTLSSGNEPISILLVDDDADCRMLIRDAIADCKVSNKVFEVENGQAAVEFLSRKGEFADKPRPGLIYLDIEMPGMDGQETLRRIRANPDLREVPVVMMTGVADEAQMKLAAENGANSYTIKPANAEQFLRTVLASTNYWLSIHQSPQHHLRPEDCRR
jgi:two-component system response regulator